MVALNDNRSLGGRVIVVTRPAHQAAPLADLITAAGGSVMLFPTLAIAELDDQQSLLETISRLDEFDMAIFVSPNAVTRAMNLITARRQLPARLRLATIGKGGVRELERHGATQVIAPARFDSEALLDLPEMQQVAGRRIVIFRGVGGRGLLGDTLSSRGAVVEYAACYRRMRPPSDPAPLHAAWANHALHAITITSSEGLRNLVDLVASPDQARLKKTPLFVPHPRIERTAHDLGFEVVVLTGQGNEQLVSGLVRWFTGRP
jgi:uroporphyrinogen-III synthase